MINRLLLVVCIFCACCSVYAQKSKILTDKFLAYQVALPQEKVYLHLDKPYYIRGEDIWFKAYVFSAELHTPTAISQILHVELISPSGIIIQKLVLKIFNGVAIGDFKLSNQLSPGQYQIRAYTRWMRNFDEDFFAQNRFSVKEEVPKEERQSDSLQKFQKLSEITQVDFFPEGGDLLDGISSKIAFKAIDNYGLGIPIRGWVIKEESDTIGTIQSIHEGMGSFMLTPQQGIQYRALVEFPDGSRAGYNLPKSKTQGLGLRVRNTQEEHLFLTVFTNQKGKNPFTLIGQLRGKVYLVHTAQVSLEKTLTLKIPKIDFPSGIMQLTLFDQQNRPQAERLIFINHQDHLKINLKSSETTYQVRDKIHVEIEVTNKANLPVMGNFSVAVTDKNLIKQAGSKANIITYSLLSSELKGYIYQPNQYLQDNSFKTIF